MLIEKALIHGIILSVGLCGWILIILRVNPRFEMKSYPKEILDGVDKQTTKEIQAIKIINIILLDL
jgi:hypothetical protein